MEFKNIKEDERLNILNHSAAHVMAQAIKNLYPNAKFWVGPVIEEGFYYDVDIEENSIKEEDFEKIEKEMKKISKSAKYIIRKEISKKEALDIFKGDRYKIDLINKFQEDEIISCYSQGDFIDLCRGPHVETTREVKHFKLLKASGAYYKGDVNEKMLQRVYGIAFYSQEDLDKHLYLIEEAKKRDHKKLGKKLSLFLTHQHAPGSVFFLHKGNILKKQLEDFWYKEHLKEGYIFINTPTMLDKELWQTSGHWENYKDNMYITKIEEKEFAIKPMNCPGGIIVYKDSIHSYKEFPLRIGELGHVHRYEASGALNGLLRLRSFTQDDAHIYMRENQIEQEVSNLIAFIDRVYKIFGLSYDIELSTRPLEKYIGTKEIWDKSQEALKRACKRAKKDFKINEGDGAFYGPKLDFHIKDSLGRSWQCATIQLDMNLPERFDLNYIEEDGSKVRPIMVHRVIYGAIERFIGILIEHFAGAFPLWLAPTQIIINPVNSQVHLDYAKEVKEKLLKEGFRVELDDRNEKLGYRMREAREQKIPYQIVLGDNEKESKTINLKIFGNDKDNKVITLDEFIKKAKKTIENYELN